MDSLAVAAGATLSALLLASTPPAAALRLLTAPDAGDPTGAVVGGAALLAWSLAGWLLLTVAATTAGHLPGVAGRACSRVARRIAPGAVRRAVEVALGLAVTGAVLGAGPAAAASPSRPGDTPAPAAISLDWGAQPPIAAPAVLPAPTTAPVVVSPGDSLWSIAEHDLARTAPPSDADVAAAWPAWWAANRDVIGPDPHLLQPGTSLVPPADRR